MSGLGDIVAPLALARARQLKAAAVQGPVLTNPQGLRRFRAALGGALYAPVYVHCVGDSTVFGTGSDDTPSGPTEISLADQRGWVGQLRTLFARHYNLPEAGFIYPKIGSGQTDSRVTKSGTTNQSSSGLLALGVAFSSTGPGTVQYAVPACTVVEELGYENQASPATGSCSVKVDGTIAGNVANGGATDTSKATKFAGLSAAAHTVLLTGTSTNSKYHYGLRYHSGAGVCVCRFGIGGINSADMFGGNVDATPPHMSGQTGAAAARLVNAWGAWGPHLVIISLGHNDAADQLTSGVGGVAGVTPARYAQQLKTATDVIVAAGGCVLIVSQQLPPTQALPVGYLNGWLDYHAAARALALANDHVAHIDAYELFRNPADAVALGLHGASTTVHPSMRGSGNIAQMLFRALVRPDLSGLS